MIFASDTDGNDGTGYAVYRVSCVCGNASAAVGPNGRSVCAVCGRPLRAEPVTRTFGTVEGLNGYLSGFKTVMIGDILADLGRKDGELKAALAEVESCRDRIRELESVREEPQTESADADLEETNRALEETNRHLTAELKRLGEFNLRDIVSTFLEFAAMMENTAMSGDLDEIRDMTEALTMQLGMRLKGEGLEMKRHRCGDVLGDGRVDVSEYTTDDPEKDLHVRDSERFGCVFRNDAYPQVVEHVNVFRYEKPEENNGQE